MKLTNIIFLIPTAFRLSTMICLLCILTSCEKFIKIDNPPNQLITSTVFEDDITARAALLGIYGKLSYSSCFSGGIYGFSLICGLSSDELKYLGSNPERTQFNENIILPTNSIINTIWSDSYGYIYGCNSLLEGLEKSTKLTPALKKQLEGEGKFLRAFVHFYLTNLFGKIAYIKSTDYNVNSIANRMDVSEVYASVIQDLVESKALLAKDYSFSNNHRSRVNRAVASSFLSKVYLFNGNYAEAEAEATGVISNPDYSLASIDNVFQIDGTEAIWQLENESSATYTNDGGFFTWAETRIDQSIAEGFVQSFDVTDLRLQNWILPYDFNGTTRYTLSKYKDSYDAPVLREASTPIRLAEIFLIRAEARAHQDKISGIEGAGTDVNVVRYRAGLEPVTASSKQQWLDLILNERKFELFLEFGSRWLDLKRMGRADDIMDPLKNSWETTDQFYPIPREEVLVNPNIRQNPGYN